MRSPPAKALLLITRRGPAVRAWAPAVSSRTWLASEWNPLVRAWTSLIHEPTPGLRFPAPLSRLPGGVGRWATSSGARRCWILAGPRGSYPLFARFQGVPAAAANVRDLGNDSRQRPAATRGSEVWKLLGLVRPERGRLSGRNPGGPVGCGGPRPDLGLDKGVQICRHLLEGYGCLFLTGGRSPSEVSRAGYQNF